MWIDKCDHVCENCAHWDVQYMVKMPFFAKGRILTFDRYAPCRKRAVEAEVGSTIVLMGADASCGAIDDQFEPSDIFLDWLKEQDAKADARLRGAYAY